jgi:hypothetical protein
MFIRVPEPKTVKNRLHVDWVLHRTKHRGARPLAHVDVRVFGSRPDFLSEPGRDMSLIGVGYAGSMGSHSSHVAVLKSSAWSRIVTIEGPGRRRHGLDGNHSVAVAAQVSCRVCG